MSQGHRQWLASELPELLSKGVLNQRAASSLGEYFNLDTLADEPQGLSKMTIILAAVGGLLIGGGIIMIFAHNWDQMSRVSRMLLALSPLIISQILALLALFPKPRGAAWREATAALMFCAVPASIALVGQTYHISNDFQSFQTLWFLLVLPFVYLLRAKLTAILAMLLAAWMAALHQGDYWLCAAALLPFHFLLEPYGRDQKNRLIGWLFALGFSVSILLSPIAATDSLSIAVLVFMGGAASIYFLGSFTEPKHGFWNRPFSNLGAAGIALNLLVYTFTDIWQSASSDSGFSLERLLSPELLLLVFAVIGLAWALRSKRTDLLPLGSALLFSLAVAFIPVSSWRPDLFSLLANSLVLSLGVWYLWRGIDDNSSSQMNFGLVLIMTLILLRFFDQDFSFIVKGIAFIIIGCAFIGSNLWQNQRGKI
ncbi:MAG: putative membrane protein [Arenicella sp.]|jgi:uncharacterized membrane protein